MATSAADVLDDGGPAALAAHGTAPVEPTPTFLDNRAALGREPATATHDVTSVRIHHRRR